MARKKRRASWTRRWHRLIGAGAGAFVIFLVISGLALNHSHRLGLDRQAVTAPWLLNWYGLGEPQQIQSFAVDGQWLSFTGSQWYLDSNIIATGLAGVGAVATGDWLVAAGHRELLLLNHAGELIERLAWGPPGAGLITALGRTGSAKVVVKTSAHLWLADADVLNWTALEKPPENIVWSSPGELPAAVRQSIVQQYRGHKIKREHLLLDLHSGRIFGHIGVLVYDLLSLTLAFLAFSGLVLWWRGRRNGRRNGNGGRNGNGKT